MLFLSCRPFVVITTFSTPTRPVENVVITRKDLQDRNNILLDGRTVENKGKLIMVNHFVDGLKIFIFPETKIHSLSN